MTIHNCDSLQDDLNALSAWSKLWLLDFNAEKCVILRINKIIKKAHQKIAMFRRCFTCLDEEKVCVEPQIK